MKVLEDALVAELAPAVCGGLVASRTGLLLQRLEDHVLTDADSTSACPFQVTSTYTLCSPTIPLEIIPVFMYGMS